MKLGNKLNIVSFGILLFLYILEKIVGISILMNILLYYINGSYLVVDNYKVTFPLSHWAYVQEINEQYLLSGKNINDNQLGVVIYKRGINIDLSSKLLDCTNLTKKKLEFKNLRGTMYLCKMKTDEIMYFQSTDKELLLRDNDVNSSNKDVMYEYNLLFNNIQKMNTSYDYGDKCIE